MLLGSYFLGIDLSFNKTQFMKFSKLGLMYQQVCEVYFTSGFIKDMNKSCFIKALH